MSKEEKAILTPVRVLNEGQIQTIHGTSLQILKKVGVKIPHPKILSLLNKIGAKVDGNTQIVRFAPELILMAIAMAQMARFYGFPLYVNTGLTDSKLCDTQSGLEKGIALLLGILSGADTFGHLGICGADQAASLHQLVVDNEIISYIKRLLKGFCVDEDTLALEVIKRIGIGGNFLTDEHTLTHLREEIWVPQLLNRDNWDQWWSLGYNSLSEIAWEKKNYLLSIHQQPPLDYNLEREIDSIVKAAKRELL